MLFLKSNLNVMHIYNITMSGTIQNSANNSQYSLQNTENYKTILHCSSNDILTKYNVLVCDYLNFITENISITNNIYNKFIIMRGLDIITNVFTIILLYSKNIDMAFFHGQKSFYFYVEFIGQISEVHHTFLQLSSRDAAMFVYKKNIFEINNDIRKKNKISSSESINMNILDANIHIMKNIIITVFTNIELSKENNKESLKIMIKRVEKIGEKINNTKITIDAIHNIKLIVNLMNIDGMSNDVYCDNIEQNIKKCIKEIQQTHK